MPPSRASASPGLRGPKASLEGRMRGVAVTSRRRVRRPFLLFLGCPGTSLRRQATKTIRGSIYKYVRMFVCVHTSSDGCHLCDDSTWQVSAWYVVLECMRPPFLVAKLRCLRVRVAALDTCLAGHSSGIWSHLVRGSGCCRGALASRGAGEGKRGGWGRGGQVPPEVERMEGETREVRSEWEVQEGQ